VDGAEPVTPSPVTPSRQPAIRLAALDMAGTTVSDEGVVERAFGWALDQVGGVPGASEVGDPETFVMRTMGQSKIEVFTELLRRRRRLGATSQRSLRGRLRRRRRSGGDLCSPGAAEVMAQLRAAGVKVCLTTGFAPATRDRILDALGWTESVDLALSPSDAGRGVRGPT